MLHLIHPLSFSSFLQYPGNQAEKDNKWEIPALVRMKVFLGLEKHEYEWHKLQKEGDLAVFAETVSKHRDFLYQCAYMNWNFQGFHMERKSCIIFVNESQISLGVSSSVIYNC